jgi:hypothetical protein
MTVPKETAPTVFDSAFTAATSSTNAARRGRRGATWPPASPASESAFGSTTPMCVRV